MGLRDAFVRILSKGSPVELNEDEPVELLLVPLAEGQLVAAELRNHGIDAHAVNSTHPLTRTVSDVRIMVRRRDVDAANAIIADRFSHEIE